MQFFKRYLSTQCLEGRENLLIAHSLNTVEAPYKWLVCSSLLMLSCDLGSLDHAIVIGVSLESSQSKQNISQTLISPRTRCEVLRRCRLSTQIINEQNNED